MKVNLNFIQCKEIGGAFMIFCRYCLEMEDINVQFVQIFQLFCRFADLCIGRLFSFKTVSKRKCGCVCSVYMDKN